MLEALGDHAVAQSIVEQAVQAQGAAAYTLAVTAIERTVEVQLAQRGNAEQALVEARREAQTAQRAAEEAEKNARIAKNKADEDSKNGRSR